MEGIIPLFERYPISSIALPTSGAISTILTSDTSIITPAGPEKSIAATKSHMGQLLSSISIYFAGKPEEFSNLLGKIKEGFEIIMDRENEIKKFAEGLLKKVVFLGSGVDYPVAREGALKLKESCSMITDAYPTREFLHKQNFKD